MHTAKISALLWLCLVKFDRLSLIKAEGIEEECTSNEDCKKLNSVCDVITSTCICLPGFQDQGQQCRQCQNKHDCLAMNYTEDVKCFKFLCECKNGTNDCFPRCPDLTAPLNGIVTYDPDTTAGSTATFACDPGFDPPTNATRTCLMDGSWDDDTIPTCTQTCVNSLCNCSLECPYENYELMCGCACYSDEFVTITTKVLNGYNILGQTVSDAEECMQLCVSTLGCVSCELYKPSNLCFLNYLLPYIIPTAFVDDITYDFYYRKCLCGN